MGSKTPQSDGRQGDGAPPRDESPNSGGKSPGSRLALSGDGCIGSNGAGDESDGDNDDDDGDGNGCGATSALKQAIPPDSTKTKKKKRSKKSKKKSSSSKESSHPRVPLADLYASGGFPAGELLDYSATRETTTTFEGLQTHNVTVPDLEDHNFLSSYRKAAEAHRQTRKWVQEFARPGKTLTEIAAGVDETVRALLGNAGLETAQGLKSGLGFPTGLSLNNVVAHYTPNPGFKDIVLQHSDVMKVDFGVHINGWIVDSAFTMSFDPIYDNLLAAVRDATNTGIKTAGVDVRISDVSAAIQEAMEAYEVEINGKTFSVKAVRNITGHNIKQYRIHGGKSIPFVKNSDQTKMEEGEIFAIETFGTTGEGWLRDGLHSLVSNGILDDYKPLVDVKGSYSAQFEHTILLRSKCKEVISCGDDY